jgi:hypothetical protein
MISCIDDQDNNLFMKCKLESWWDNPMYPVTKMAKTEKPDHTKCWRGCGGTRTRQLLIKCATTSFSV